MVEGETNDEICLLFLHISGSSVAEILITSERSTALLNLIRMARYTDVVVCLEAYMTSRRPIGNRVDSHPAATILVA
jgi:hypothetical protein